jgi:type VI secretion system secreted protein Hcp
MAVVDYFLKLEGIEGESHDSKHKNEIDVESWSWGEINSGAHSAGGGGGAGKVSVNDFSFVMRVNKASPKLMLACADGTHIKKGTLVCRKAGKDQQEYLVIKLDDLLVSSYQTGGSHGDVLPMDSCSLNFSKIVIEYKPQNPDGSLGSTVTAGWNVKENKKA